MARNTQVDMASAAPPGAIDSHAFDFENTRLQTLIPLAGPVAPTGQ